jgi:methyl-accepting chemotaxis protein PixJ
MTANLADLDPELLAQIEDGIFTKKRIYLKKIKNQIESANTLEDKLQAVVRTIGQELKADRVFIYRLDAEGKGTALTEFINNGWTPLIGESLPPAICGAVGEQDLVEPKILVCNDRQQLYLSAYHKQIWERFQIEASLAVPFVIEGRLWGFLVLQQCETTRTWQESEICLIERLTQELKLILQPEELQLKLQMQLERETALAKTIQSLQEAQDLKTIFRTVTQEARKLIQGDRVLIYQFKPDWSGEVLAESVDYQWTAVIELQKVDRTLFTVEMNDDERCTLKNLQQMPVLDADSYLIETKGGNYAKGKKFQAVNDVYAENFSPCYLQSLQKYQAKAYIIVPIFVNRQLWGLFAIYQCSAPRVWQPNEIKTMLQLGTTLGIAIQQTELTKEYQTKQEQDSIISKIVNCINLSDDLNFIFAAVVTEVRKILSADRVLIYRFQPDWSGSAIAESVATHLASIADLQQLNPNLKLNIGLDQSCRMFDAPESNYFERETFFASNRGKNLHPGKEYYVVDNLDRAGFSLCYVSFLEKYQAKAYIIVPLFHQEKLYGLLAVYQSYPRYWQTTTVDFVRQISQQLNFALQKQEYRRQIEERERQIRENLDREQSLAVLLERLQKARTAELVYRTAAHEARKILQTDRVAIYRFLADWSGEFVGEAMVGNWMSAMKNLPIVADTHLQETQGGRYKFKNTLVVNNIYQAGHQPCHIELLEQFEAKAYMIAPIFVNDRLWGLACAYQNSAPRDWYPEDLNVLKQVGIQVGVALQQIEYWEQLQQKSEHLQQALERETRAKDLLQQRAIELLDAVKPSFQGDLTVKAAVTEDEIGTIASAYNTTLDSLHKIVTQVKGAIEMVATTTDSSTTAITGLSVRAQQQFQEISHALNQIKTVVEFSATTTNIVKQVEEAIELANETVQVGDRRMDRTVENILSIRQTTSEASSRVKRLNESSQKISKVVSSIGSFATQTNLLALNAALEATRAGEYGKGFSVVADEVRNLALQSAQATKEIDKLVQEIQSETQQVAAAMDLGIEKVAEGTNSVNETRQSLNEIIAVITRIANSIEDITRAANTQTHQAESVSQVMSQVATIANNTSQDSLSISNSFQEILTMARELQTTISQFKVN